MNTGSVVILTRPYEGNESFRDEMGVVIGTHISHCEPSQLMCTVRFTDPDFRPIHRTLEIYAHRLDVIKE